ESPGRISSCSAFVRHACGIPSLALNLLFPVYIASDSASLPAGELIASVAQSTASSSRTRADALADSTAVRALRNFSQTDAKSDVSSASSSAPFFSNQSEALRAIAAK